MYPVDLENNERLCEYSAIVEYMVPGRFAPNPVRPLSRFAPNPDAMTSCLRFFTPIDL
jgi:hypothetical protein